MHGENGAKNTFIQTWLHKYDISWRSSVRSFILLWLIFHSIFYRLKVSMHERHSFKGSLLQDYQTMKKFRLSVPSKDWCTLFRTKHSSKTLLRLVRINVHQSLGLMKNLVKLLLYNTTIHILLRIWLWLYCSMYRLRKCMYCKF